MFYVSWFLHEDVLSVFETGKSKRGKQSLVETKW